MNARELIVAVMREVQGVAKKDKNTQQGFSFRGIDAVVNAVGPALRKHGGFIVPNIEGNAREVVASRNGGSLNVTRLEVAFSVYGTEGDPIIGVVAAEAFDSGDKATAKAMSVAYRTFILQTFCLPTDEPDPDSFSYETGERPVKKKVVRPDVPALLEQVKSLDDIQALYVQAQTDGWWDAEAQALFSERKAAL